jgi:hypothetical protein
MIKKKTLHKIFSKLKPAGWESIRIPECSKSSNLALTENIFFYAANPLKFSCTAVNFVLNKAVLGDFHKKENMP